VVFHIVTFGEAVSGGEGWLASGLHEVFTSFPVLPGRIIPIKISHVVFLWGGVEPTHQAGKRWNLPI
jgi:hypothetical protein